jgi:hypothetical protein
MEAYKKLLLVQSQIIAPKKQFNKFGNYYYRNCEDILEAFKPLGKATNSLIKIEDKIVQIGGRYYVEATAHFIDIDTGKKVTNVAYAREEENKKGMDASQVTGATSSYARKYALNGLLAIDDTKDSDTTNTHEKKAPKTRDELIKEFDFEMKRTGKEPTKETKYIKTEELIKGIEALKKLPDKVVKNETNSENK